MPSLIRFLTIIGVIVGLFFGAMYILGSAFEPEEREMTSTRKVKLK